MPKFQLDHVAIALHSIKPALKLFRDTLGGEYLMGGDERDVWRWLQVRYPGGGKVELLEPMGEGFLKNFLDKRGEGLHHVTFKTDDLTSAIDHIKALGWQLVDIDLSQPDWKEAFFRPSQAHGTLIQVAQSSATDEQLKGRLNPSGIDEILS